MDVAIVHGVRVYANIDVNYICSEQLAVKESCRAQAVTLSGFLVSLTLESCREN